MRPDTVIRGSSGLDHQVQAIAVDDRGKRVIIVSAEPNPRMAAMMQVGVQATLTDAKVLVARPLAFDLPEVIRRTLQPLGLSEIDIARARAWIKSIQDDQGQKEEFVAALGVHKAIHDSLAAFHKTEMPAMPQILGLVAGQRTTMARYLQDLRRDRCKWRA